MVAMDRYLAWLQTNGEEIFETSSPKLLFWGFALVILISLALAVIGWPIREV